MTLNRLPITGLPASGLPPAAIVCGDPGRAELVGSFLQETKLLSNQREYASFLGTYDDLPVAVCSHGVGAPGAAIAFEELIYAGARWIIRVGTCGALQPKMAAGHLVIATAAVQNTGYGREVVPEGYPAVADAGLILALRRSAVTAGAGFSSGLVLTRDAFYQGIAAVGTPNYAQMAQTNVQAVEMECAALFVVASLRNVCAGAILAVDGNVLEGGGEAMDTYKPQQVAVRAAVEMEIKIALEALKMVVNDAG
jgi:uridine phosphorylase